MTPEMTKLYQRHADHKAKTAALGTMPDFIAISNGADTKLLLGGIMAEIQELLNKADNKQMVKILAFIKREVKP